jgi:hypothetical protein
MMDGLNEFLDLEKSGGINLNCKGIVFIGNRKKVFNQGFILLIIHGTFIRLKCIITTSKILPPVVIDIL